jgi:uncharacterized protein (DUF3820 family)
VLSPDDEKAARARACKCVMPFGKHRGKTLRDIAVDDPDGARYLDWVASLDDLREPLREALRVFLAIPWVSELVDRSMESRDYDEPEENAREPRPWWDRGEP